MRLQQFDSVVFDFSQTLSSDIYFRTLGAEFLTVVQKLLFAPKSSTVDRWMAGEWSSWDVSTWLASQTGVAPDVIDAELRCGCACMQFNFGVMTLAQNLHRNGTRTSCGNMRLNTLVMALVSKKVC